MAPPQLGTPNASSAGYGRSCTNCSRAKCKCILRPESQVCERCARLQKDCQPMVSSRKRTVKKSTSSRTAQLEEKLDDLVSILRAGQTQNQHIPGQPRTDENTPSSTRTESTTDPALQGPRQFASRLDSLATAATSSPTATAPFRVPNHSDVRCLEPNLTPKPRLKYLPEHLCAEADRSLKKFRSWLPYFGFLHLPDSVTSEDLRRERPFLYAVIMNITAMSTPEQQVMAENIRRDVAQRLLVDHERTMDLLVGLVIYVAWAHFNTGPGSKAFLLTYTQLALTVAYELGLNKSPSEEQSFTSCFKAWGPPKGGIGVGFGRPPVKPRTMEERRTILALWFMTSIIRTFLGKTDTMQWTPHMQESLEILQQKPEVPSDTTFATLVRLQILSDEAQDLLLRDALDEDGDTPSYLFRKGLIARFKRVQEEIPPGMFSNANLQAQFHMTEAQIHSVGVLVGNRTPESVRIEGLYAVLRAVRSWYDLFLGMPLDDMPGLPFSYFVQLTQSQIALYKLTVIDDEAWDKSVLRSTADLTVIFDRSIERFQQMHTVYPMKSADEAPTIFAKGAMIIRNLKASWEPALTPHLGGLPTPQSQATAGSTANLPTDLRGDPNAVLPDLNTFDFGDMTWITDVFGPWDF